MKLVLIVCLLVVLSKDVVARVVTPEYVQSSGSGGNSNNSIKVYTGAHSISYNNTKYDGEIRKWMAYYNTTIPFSVIKGLLIQESGLNPRAVSSAGAKGIGQFMPDTWSMMQTTIWGGEVRDVFNTSYNIRATVYYSNWLYNNWKSKRSELSRLQLTLASYNAGLGNLLKAQKLSGGSVEYHLIEPHLHKVTGGHSNETKDYVRRVMMHSRRIDSGGGEVQL